MSLPREGARVTREGILMSVPMNWGLSPDKAVPYRVHTQGQIEGACTAGTVRQPDRNSATFEAWLALYTDLEIVARDRSTGYARAAQAVVPRAQQAQIAGISF